MRYLLDTCAAVWFFEGSDRLPAQIRDELTDPGHEVYVSDVSVLELVTKHQLGKFPLAQPPERVLPVLIRRHGLASLPLLSRHIYGLQDLPLHHRDPFDRLLISQSRRERLLLVTPDPLIARYDVKIAWS